VPGWRSDVVVTHGNRLRTEISETVRVSDEFDEDPSKTLDSDLTKMTRAGLSVTFAGTQASFELTGAFAKDTFVNSLKRREPATSAQ
jgi:hypothetical protein